MINKRVTWYKNFNKLEGTLCQFVSTTYSDTVRIVGIVLMKHGIFVEVPFQDLYVMELLDESIGL